MVNPCCCELQKGTQAVAVLQIVGSILNILILTISVINTNEFYHKKDQSVPGGFVVGAIFDYLMIIFSLFLGILLLIGAYGRDLQKCKIWFYAMLIITILTNVSAILFGCGGNQLQALFIIIFYLYFLWVVYAFMEEVKGGPPFSDP